VVERSKSGDARTRDPELLALAHRWSALDEPARARFEARGGGAVPNALDASLRADPIPHAEDPTARSTRVFGGVVFAFTLFGLTVAVRLRRRATDRGARPRAF